MSKLLGEAIVLTVLLGTSLKFAGKFIVQTQSDGPVSMLVVDFTTPDAVRAYANYDAQRIEEAIASGQISSAKLLGRGTLAMTVDQGENTQRYQGIVALEETSLEEAALTYFRQSEQIPTYVRMAVAEALTPQKGEGFTHAWRAGGILIQYLPREESKLTIRDIPGGDAPVDAAKAVSEERSDFWLEAKSLVATVSDDELTDPDIGSQRLLYRLFHEHGVHIFAGPHVADKCSCSKQRIVDVLTAMNEQTRTETMQDGKITSTCQFCSTRYTIVADDLKHLL